MSGALEAGLVRLEEAKELLLDRLADVDERRLQVAPGPGRWSAAQVLGHVVLVERLSLQYVRKKIQDPSRLERAGLRSVLRLLALRLALRSPLRFKAPAATSDIPAGRDLDSLRTEWAEVRRGWREFVQSYPTELRDRAIYRHPFAGRLSLEHTLSFMLEHLVHHARQVAGILRGAASAA